jgi:hypothetical protein
MPAEEDQGEPAEEVDARFEAMGLAYGGFFANLRGPHVER